MLDQVKFRVWWNGQMIYPETEDKPCDWLIDQSGKLQSFPNKLGVVYDPAQYERAVYMRWTGWRSKRYDVYQGDIVRDCDGYLGMVVWSDEQGCWDVKSRDYISPIAEYSQEDELISMGNIYQNADWEEWTQCDEWLINEQREQRKEIP